ncbi:hypothetical protein ACHAQJ_002810 [Trichoderma viride]
MSSPSYPKTFDLPEAPAAVSRRGIRGPSAPVTRALLNPLLLGNRESGSQTTATNTNTNITGSLVVDAAAADNADSRIQSGLSKPNVQALDALDNGPASQGHKTSGLPTSCVNMDETMSVSSMTASYHKAENEDPYSPASGPQTDFEVSCMELWADDKINNLSKE